ncbi:MAG: DUF3572 domain-containing protein [Sphingomonadaceae bacterium]
MSSSGQSPNLSGNTAGDADILALQALGWVLSDEDRAQRFLALTGLTPDSLRDGLNDRAVLLSVLDFLAGHEPDLILAASTLDVTPETLITASERLS